MSAAASFEVAIPSYRRAATLQRKTLPMLRSSGVGPERIRVFVADAEERACYEGTLDPTAYNELVVGARGMVPIRRYIHRYYPEGTRLVCCDDDLDALHARQGSKGSLPIEDLPELIETAFALAAAGGATLWGVYPVHNPYYMDDTVTYDLRYIVGAFWGCRNSHEERRMPTYPDKEDFERTILWYLADGAVCRLNYAAPVTRYYEEPGGMQVERTEQSVTKGAIRLLTRYPELCRVNTRKKGPHLEVSLRDRRPSAPGGEARKRRAKR